MTTKSAFGLAEFGDAVSVCESTLRAWIIQQKPQAPKIVHAGAKILVIESPEQYLARLATLDTAAKPVARSPGRPRRGETPESYAERVQQLRQQRMDRAS